MPLYIAQNRDLDRCYRCLMTDSQTLKDSATQLPIKYKSGALVTQYINSGRDSIHNHSYGSVSLSESVVQRHTYYVHIVQLKN